MSETDNSILEDLERYRRNNVELAMALNDLKTELNMVQMQVLGQNRELQNVHDENAALKRNLTQKDSQLSAWRALIVDVVTTNTKKYTEMMQKVGLVPAANGTTKPTEYSTMQTGTKVSTTTKPTEQSNVCVNVHRRLRQEDVSPYRLADLTEESIHSHFNESKSLTTSPENIAHVAARRRMSVPQMTPPSPLRVIQERLVGNGETKGRKSSTKVQKMDRIMDENTSVIAANGRSKRNAAPKNLSEPKLGTKLRRN